MKFEAGDKVVLKVAPMKGVLRFGKKGKLSLRFVGPFEILKHGHFAEFLRHGSFIRQRKLSYFSKHDPKFGVGSVAYRLALPPSLFMVHNVFHVSMLRKYLTDPSHVVDFKPLQLNEKLSYEEKLAQIVAREVKVLRSKEVPLVKVLWHNHQFEEATWEREDEMRALHPELFQD
ncbi:uncharacterized protein LOC120078024 [Benincasa hispida]|uniref:uncharacterized protein LOC120078024 n=1 Tax=Benincasa hispida TaxID=102211 RepID=UPI0018FF8B68|nr:uncharacterized protein LOC120078024 [Benincasa hispida]